MKPKTGRKRGGQPGNHNALRHGFYARHFTPDEQARLGKTSEGLQSEIDLLRCFADRIANELSKVETFTEADLKRTNTMVTICLAIGTLTRDQAFLYGKVSSVDKVIEEALTTRRGTDDPTKPLVTSMTSHLTNRAIEILETFDSFSSEGGGVKLYKYQLEPAEAILESVRLALGLTFVLVLSLQTGKNELLCHLKAYLMRHMDDKERVIVEVNPTYKPQTIQAIMRLENRMNANCMCMKRWKKRNDYIRYIGGCRTSFLSGDNSASVVGASADLLLIINEAQDIAEGIYDKKFSPMAASCNATQVLCGTAWTSQTLLVCELRAARKAEESDGRQRVFFVTAKEVGKENGRYATYVEGEVNWLSRNHPLIRTQYFCEEIDAQLSMFNPTRLALTQGDQPGYDDPRAGQPQAAITPTDNLRQQCAAISAKPITFLIDVAGQDEARTDPNSDAPLENPGRDSVSLSIVSVDLSTP